MMALTPHHKAFENNRDLMYALAYRMLGSISDAEDVVQDAFFRWRGVDLSRVDSPRAYLSTVVSRLCVDRQRRRKIEKLNYIGPWLPEPVDTGEPGPAERSEVAESISFAFLHLLETLNPLERAVFILRESFDLPHDSVASMLDIEPAYSRQLLRRAKAKLGDFRNAAAQEPGEEVRRLLATFAEATASGDLDKLREVLADDVVSLSDGGGRVTAALIPLYGFDRVTRVLIHVTRKNLGNVAREWRHINGNWGLVSRGDDGVHSVTTVAIENGRITTLFVVRNPAKLRGILGNACLGPETTR